MIYKLMYIGMIYRNDILDSVINIDRHVFYHSHLLIVSSWLSPKKGYIGLIGWYLEWLPLGQVDYAGLFKKPT